MRVCFDYSIVFDQDIMDKLTHGNEALAMSIMNYASMRGPNYIRANPNCPNEEMMKQFWVVTESSGLYQDCCRNSISALVGSVLLAIDVLQQHSTQIEGTLAHQSLMLTALTSQAKHPTIR